MNIKSNIFFILTFLCASGAYHNCIVGMEEKVVRSMNVLLDIGHPGVFVVYAKANTEKYLNYAKPKLGCVEELPFYTYSLQDAYAALNSSFLNLEKKLIRQEYAINEQLKVKFSVAYPGIEKYRNLNIPVTRTRSLKQYFESSDKARWYIQEQTEKIISDPALKQFIKDHRHVAPEAVRK